MGAFCPLNNTLRRLFACQHGARGPISSASRASAESRATWLALCTQARSRRKTTTTVTLSVAPWSRASPISRLAIMSGDLAVWRQQWTMRASSSTWRARRQRDQGFGRRLGEARWLHHTAHAAVALLYSPGVARAQAGRAPRAASGHSPWGDNYVRAWRYGAAGERPVRRLSPRAASGQLYRYQDDEFGPAAARPTAHRSR